MTIRRNGNYNDWARHFGRSTLDPELIAEFRAAGIAQIPVIARDDVQIGADIGALTVNLWAPSVLGNEEKLGEGVGILSGIAIHLKDYGNDGYTGPMPFSIMRDDTRETLREKIGESTTSSKDGRRDKWLINGLRVTAKYSEGFNDILVMTVFLPEGD